MCFVVLVVDQSTSLSFSKYSFSKKTAHGPSSSLGSSQNQAPLNTLTHPNKHASLLPSSCRLPIFNTAAPPHFSTSSTLFTASP